MALGTQRTIVDAMIARHVERLRIDQPALPEPLVLEPPLRLTFPALPVPLVPASPPGFRLAVLPALPVPLVPESTPRFFPALLPAAAAGFFLLVAMRPPSHLWRDADAPADGREPRP